MSKDRVAYTLHANAPWAAAWTRLDLSPSAGVTCGASVDGLLRGAAAKANGEVTFLDVSGRSLRVEVLLQVLGANSQAMRELRVTVRCDPSCRVAL